MFNEIIDTLCNEILLEKNTDRKYALASSLKEILQATLTYEYVNPPLTEEEIEEN